MIKRLLPQILYKGYDILNSGRLSQYYKAVKEANEQHKPYASEDVRTYLEKWEFHPVLEDNSLMNKSDIKQWVEKIDSDIVHSWAYTGGSYGEPLRVPYSKKRANIRTATFKYFNEIGGYELGDPFVLIRAKNKSPFIKLLRNETIFVPYDLSEDNIEKFLSELKKKNIKVLMGYPTVMYEVALFLQRYPDKKRGLNIQSLISVSEPLEQVKREIIKNIFECSFVDRYSNEEVGLIAQQKAFGEEHFVNKAGVLVEVVNEETFDPVKEGEQGKVVVTDLYNDLIPIVRYDTGDLAVAHRYKDGQLLSIREITGRTTEQVFSVSGKQISPLTLGPYIYKPLSKEGSLYQYQFAQTGKGKYELRIKAREKDLSKDVLNKIIRGLQSVLESGADISTKYVRDIQPLPSGKRPVFKNEMSNTEC